MTYFHTDEGNTLNWLVGVVTEACAQGQRLRLDVDSRGNLRVKRGEGGWSSPIASTPDPYRDLSQTPDPQPDTDEGLVCEQCEGTNGMHYIDCDAFAWL